MRPTRKADKDRKNIPFINAGTDTILRYMKFFFDTDKKNGFRNWRMSRLYENHLFKTGEHWKYCDQNSRRTSVGFQWVNNTKYIVNGRKPPVDNMIGSGIRNLVSRTCKKEYEPEPFAEQRLPEMEAAARMTRDILMWDTKDQRFQQEIDEPFVDDLWTFGTAWAISRLDEPNTDSITTASQTASKCVGCGAMFADKSLSVDDIGNRFMDENAQRTMDRSEASEDGMRTLGVCPMCDEGGNLEPYMPDENEAAEGMDAFGRPMGSSVPRSKALWECPPLHELHPENGGIGDTHDCRVWGWESVRSIQWIDAHCPPDFDLNRLKPTPAPELLRTHPSLGDQFGISEENIYADHMIVRELIAEALPYGGDGPEDGLSWGLRYLMIGEELVIAEPLEREVSGSDERVATVTVAAGVCDRVRGEFWGRTPTTDAIPLNRELNELDFIERERTRRGIPLMALPQGVDFYARKKAGGLWNMFGYTNEGADQNWKPQDSVMFGGPHVTGNVNRRDQIAQSIRDILGPGPTDNGGAGGSNSARQINVQVEQANQKMNNVDAARVAMKIKLLSHHADLKWGFLRGEKGEYERKTTAGTYEVKSYEGNELVRQKKIKLQVTASTDESLLQAEKAEKALSGMLYGDPAMMSQQEKDQLLELMGLPKLDGQQGVQVKMAEQSWSEFEKRRVIPYLDTTIADSWIHFQVWGKRWLGDEARDIQRAAGWDQALRKLSGWEVQLAQATAKNDQQKAVYAGYPPEQWPEIQQQLTDAVAQQNEAMLPGPMAPPGTPPPGPPMPPPIAPPQGGAFLPESMCDRMLQLWRGMLAPPAAPMMPGQAGMPGPPMAPDPATLPPDVQAMLKPEVQAQAKAAQELDSCLQMYAAIQEARLDAKGKSAGAPAPAAPGGSSTPAGNVPTPGQPVMGSRGTEAAAGGG